jgi:hypothetical protein
MNRNLLIPVIGIQTGGNQTATTGKSTGDNRRFYEVRWIEFPDASGSLPRGRVDRADQGGDAGNQRLSPFPPLRPIRAKVLNVPEHIP